MEPETQTAPDAEEDPQPDPDEGEVETVDGEEEAEPDEPEESDDQVEEEDESDEEASEEESAEDEESEEEEEDDSDAGWKALPEWAKARISKGVEERNEARAEVESLKEQLESAEAITVTPTVSNPLADITDEKGIAKWEADFETWVAQAEDAIAEGGAEFQGEYKDAKWWSGYRRHLRSMESAPDDHREFLKESQASRNNVKEFRPEVYQRGTAENGIFTEWKQMILKRKYQHLDELLALAISYLPVVQGKAKLIPFKETPPKKKAAPKAKKKTPPKGPGTAAGAPGPGKPRDTDHAAAIAKAIESGDSDAEAEALADMLNL